MSTEETKVLYTDEAAAKKVTVEGWLSRNGRFYPGTSKDHEHMARYDGCTHIICDCGQEAKKGWTKCDECRQKTTVERYNNMPFKEWDGAQAICLMDADEDEYFFSEEDLMEYCDDLEIDPSDLMLVICKENRPHQIDPDYWSDEMPPYRELDDVFSTEALQKIKELNEILSKHGPISYSPGKYRTSYQAPKEPYR